MNTVERSAATRISEHIWMVLSMYMLHCIIAPETCQCDRSSNGIRIQATPFSISRHERAMDSDRWSDYQSAKQSSTKLPILPSCRGVIRAGSTPTWPSFSLQGREQVTQNARHCSIDLCPGSTMHTGHHHRVTLKHSNQMLMPQQPLSPSRAPIPVLHHWKLANIQSMIIHFQKNGTKLSYHF